MKVLEEKYNMCIPDLEKCAQWIEELSLTKVALQFPDDLLDTSVEIALFFKKRLNKMVYIMGDTSYGSCCIDKVTANHVDAEGIIHFGHACLSPTSGIPIYYILPKNEFDVKEFCEKFSNYIEDTSKATMLFYDVSYAHVIEEVVNTLTLTYQNLIISKLNCTSNVEYVNSKCSESCTVFGRSYNLKDNLKEEDCDAVFVGPVDKTLNCLAMSIPVKSWTYYEGSTFKPFLPLDNPWLKRRRYLVEKLKDANIVGIVVATLGIQDYKLAIDMMKSILKKMNKKTYIFSVGKINPAKLSNFPEVDAFIVIACPESDIFDSRDFCKPLLMPYEVELAFNSNRDFTLYYTTDFRQILPGGMNYVNFIKDPNVDVSLLSGDVRTVCVDNSESCDSSEVAHKGAGTVSLKASGANFLLARTWQGLDQNLGKDEVKPVEIGRSGIPIGYENERITNIDSM